MKNRKLLFHPSVPLGDSAAAQKLSRHDVARVVRVMVLVTLLGAALVAKVNPRAAWWDYLCTIAAVVGCAYTLTLGRRLRLRRRLIQNHKAVWVSASHMAYYEEERDRIALVDDEEARADLYAQLFLRTAMIMRLDETGDGVHALTSYGRAIRAERTGLYDRMRAAILAAQDDGREQ